MNLLKLIFLLALIAPLTSCLEEKPLSDSPLSEEPLGAAVELTAMQNEFLRASGFLTPEGMKKGEWAYFRSYARLYTGNYQDQGYTTAQVLETSPIENENIDGVAVPIKKINTLMKYYLPISHPDDIPQEDPNDPAKEWACKYATAPYYQWYGECSLPPEQNLWVFHYLGTPSEPIFFGLQKSSGKVKLPEKMIKEGRCYNFENCEIAVNILKYDIVFKNSNGGKERRRYTTTFAPQLPYLASNIKTCFASEITIDGNKHPIDFCQELVDFRFEEEVNN